MNCEKLDWLVRRLKNGEKEHFTEFYNMTKVAVYYTIKKIVKQDDAVEDIMQEAYVKFINSLHKIDEDKNPYSYLLTICKNQAIDFVKKHSRTEYTDNEQLLDSIDYEQQENMDMPLIEFCKKNLTEDEFKIIEMTVILGYKRVEVAKLLNEPISTINWKYNHILKKIKSLYKEVYIHEN